MYKNKDGKVIASLTEVKNKTGDIFAIVDEFGEISLTSYNKVRYKIIKVDIENIVDINANGPVPKVATTPKKSSKTVELEVRDNQEAETESKEVLEEIEKTAQVEIEAPKAEIIEAQPEVEEPVQAKLFDKTVDLDIWDREGKSERQFSLNAIRPLIS